MLLVSGKKTVSQVLPFKAGVVPARSSVDGDGFAVDVIRVIRAKEGRQVGQLFVTSRPAGGDSLEGALAGPRGRHQAGTRTLGWKHTWGHGVYMHIVPRPLNSQSPRHGQHSRFGRTRMDGSGAGAGCIGGQNVQNAAVSLDLHRFQRGARAIEAAIQNNVHDRTPSVIAELFGLAEKVARGIVDQDVKPAETAQGFPDHILDLLGNADIGGNRQGLSSATADLRAGGLEM